MKPTSAQLRIMNPIRLWPGSGYLYPNTNPPGMNELIPSNGIFFGEESKRVPAPNSIDGSAEKRGQVRAPISSILAMPSSAVPANIRGMLAGGLAISSDDTPRSLD